MAEQVERHKSQRWVKANVPSYNDWGDNDDYEYDDDTPGYDYGSSHTPAMPPLPDLKSLHLSLEVSQALDAQNNSGEDSVHSNENHTQKNTYVVSSSNPELVLSIDTMQKKLLDDEDEDDEDEEEEDDDDEELESQYESKKETLSTNTKEDHEEVDEFQDSKDHILRSNSPLKQTSKNEVPLPSLPPLSTPVTTHGSQFYHPPSKTGFTDPSYTPTSEASFTSDTDSIQHEPTTLNVKLDSHYDNISTVYDIQEEEQSQSQLDRRATEKIYDNESVPVSTTANVTKEFYDTQSEQSLSKPSLISEPPKLELTIDRLQRVDDDDDSSDDDWGYNGNNSDDEEPEVEDVVKEPVTLVVDHKDALDRAHTPELISTHLPGPGPWTQNLGMHPDDSQDSIDFGKPDILNLKDHSISKDHSSDPLNNNISRQDTLIHGLNIVKSPQPENQGLVQAATTDHLDDLINEINEASIRSDDNVNDNEIMQRSYNNSVEEMHKQYSLKSKPSIRKPPPEVFSSPEKESYSSDASPSNRLVSGDYSNIADAVNSYMNEGDAASGIHTQTIHEDEGEHSEENGSVKEWNANDEGLEVDVPSVPPIPISKSESSDSNDITGFAPPPIPGSKGLPQPPSIGEDRPLVSRMSTMSSNTFNFGEWEPNTNNYRDEFIGHNDRDSVLPSIRNSEQYKSFTTSGNRQTDDDVDSFNSIPETIDAKLPSIHEDHDYHQSNENWSDRDLNSTVTRSSILSDKPYDAPKFQEEKLTPGQSLEALNGNNQSSKELPQKYSSLLGPVDEDSSATPEQETVTVSDKEKTHSRSQSHGSISTLSPPTTRVASAGATSTLSTYVTNDLNSKTYPVFSWKAIMAVQDPAMRIGKLKEALELEAQYDSGLQLWLNQILHQQDESSNIQIGQIATAAYQNAAHSDIRRHQSLRSKVNIVKDKMENSGHLASSFGKRFFSKSKKLVASNK